MSIAIISNTKELKNSIVLEFAHIARGYMYINTFEKFYYEKQAENGLQSRSSENGKTAVQCGRIEIAVMLKWR